MEKILKVSATTRNLTTIRQIADKFKYKNLLQHSRRFLFIIRRMHIPANIVPETELRRNTGERGTRKFVAYKGLVYDVTDCPKWRVDLHEQLHFAGQDLTSELPDAPHNEDVFTRPCVKVIGKLQTT